MKGQTYIPMRFHSDEGSQCRLGVPIVMNLFPATAAFSTYASYGTRFAWHTKHSARLKRRTRASDNPEVSVTSEVIRAGVHDSVCT